MNRSGIAVLRTKLRELNIEYSALVRGKMREGSLARMEELRAERRALMALVAQHRREDFEHQIAVCSLAGAVSSACGDVLLPGTGALSLAGAFNDGDERPAS